MKSFLVFGLGRFGSNLAKTLVELGYEVLGVDENMDRVQQMSSVLTHVVQGDPKDESFLRSIGVRNFDCAVVSTSSDMQSSTLITMLLKEMGVKYIVSKAQSEVHMRILQRVGADRVVFPEKDMGMKVAQSLAVNNIIDYIELSDHYSIIEVHVPQKWIGKSPKMLQVRTKYGVSILAIKQDGTRQIDVSPDPDRQLMENDILVVLGANEDISRITD